MRRISACALLLAMFATAPAVAQPVKIIFDTDFAFPPQDDAMALFFVLNSPELELLGITTVAGNRSLNVATADALKVLEVTGHAAIPVFQGAASPLLHEKAEWDLKRHGGWYANDPAPAPPGGFAKKKVEARSAVDFLVGTVMQNPGQVTILAIGPLTNIAMAMRMESNFARNVKQLVIMGGAIASLPDGGGNHTPNAEFNFYVDPEAAQIVLRSGIPIVLSPLNVSRKTKFTKESYDKIVAVDTPITRLVKQELRPRFEQRPNMNGLMYDQVAAVTLVAPRTDEDGRAVRGRGHQSQRQLRRLGRRTSDLARWRRGSKDAGPDRSRLGPLHPVVCGTRDTALDPKLICVDENS